MSNKRFDGRILNSVFNKELFRIKGNESAGDIVVYEDRFECKSSWIIRRTISPIHDEVIWYDNITKIKAKKGFMFLADSLDFYSSNSKSEIYAEDNWDKLKKIEEQVNYYHKHKEEYEKKKMELLCLQKKREKYKNYVECDDIDNSLELDEKKDLNKIDGFINSHLKLNVLDYFVNNSNFVSTMRLFTAIKVIKSKKYWKRLNKIEQAAIDELLLKKTNYCFDDLFKISYKTLFWNRHYQLINFSEHDVFYYDENSEKFILNEKYKKSHLFNESTKDYEDKNELICYFDTERYGMNYYGLKNVAVYKCPICGNVGVLYYSCDKNTFKNRSQYGKKYKCPSCQSEFDSVTSFSRINSNYDDIYKEVMYYSNLESIVNQRNDFLTKEIYNHFSIIEPSEIYSFEEIFNIINNKLVRASELLSAFMNKKGFITFNYLSQLMFNYYIAFNYPVKNTNLIVDLDKVNYYNCLKNFDLFSDSDDEIVELDPYLSTVISAKKLVDSFIDEFKRLINAFYDYLRQEKYLETKRVLLSDVIVTLTIVINSFIAEMNSEYFKMHQLIKYDNCSTYEDYIKRFVKLENEKGTVEKFKQISNDVLDVFSDCISLKCDVSCVLRLDVLNLYYYLVQQGMIDVENNRVLNYFDKFIVDIVNHINVATKKVETFTDYLNELNRLEKNYRYYTINDIDLLDGLAFEKVVCDLLTCMGYESSVTKSSRDQGIDVIAYKGNVKYGIQTKRYFNKVTNSAVQEVVAGLKYYGCETGIVITNSYFTNAAKELAEANGIVLWDREELAKRLQENKLAIK